MNDDQSPLTTLISCIECAKTMRIERIDPESDGKDIIRSGSSRLPSEQPELGQCMDVVPFDVGPLRASI